MLYHVYTLYNVYTCDIHCIATMLSTGSSCRLSSCNDYIHWKYNFLYTDTGYSFTQMILNDIFYTYNNTFYTQIIFYTQLTGSKSELRVKSTRCVQCNFVCFQLVYRTSSCNEYTFKIYFLYTETTAYQIEIYMYCNWYVLLYVFTLCMYSYNICIYNTYRVEIGDAREERYFPS